MRVLLRQPRPVDAVARREATPARESPAPDARTAQQTAADVLALQRDAGNAAATALLTHMLRRDRAGRSDRAARVRPAKRAVATGAATAPPGHTAGRPLQRKVEIRPPGPGTLSAYGRRRALVNKINAQSTGAIFRLSGRTLRYDVLNRDLLGNFERVLMRVIDAHDVIPLLLVPNAQTVAGNQPMLIDSLELGYLDVDDMLASSDASFQLNLIHILSERARVRNYAARIPGQIQEHPAAHRAGLRAEAEHLKSLLEDATIVVGREDVDNVSGTALFQFHSAAGGYRILHSFRLGAGGVQHGHVVVITSDHRRLPLDEFIAERKAAAAKARPADRVPAEGTDARGAADTPRRQVAPEATQDVAGSGVREDRTVDPGIQAMIDERRGGGQSLPAALRESLERRLGEKAPDVRVHSGQHAAMLARAVDARAFTVGTDIFFGAGEYQPGTPDGDRLLAHELQHTLQQRGAPESGALHVTEAGDEMEREAEQTALGAVGAEGFASTPGPRARIAANRRTLARSEPGEHVQFGTSERLITLPGSGVRIKERYLIAMADVYKDPDALLNATGAEIEALVKLIERDEQARTGRGGKSPTEDDWQQWSMVRPEGQRYMDLNAANEYHFADLNKERWAALHTRAIREAWRGRVSTPGVVCERASVTNGFANHFLTDAFSAGHLVNKVALMAAAKKTVEAGSTRDDLALAVAKGMLSDPKVGRDLSGMLIKSWGPGSVIPGGWARATVERLAGLLSSVMYWEKAFLSVFVKAAHDDLNQAIGLGQGVLVENLVGDRWRLPGDTTLRQDRTTGRETANPDQPSDTLRIGRNAVRETERNLQTAADTKYEDELDKALPDMLARVWRHVPIPTRTARPEEGQTGQAQVDQAIATYTNAADPKTVKRIVALSISEWETARRKLIEKNLMLQLPMSREERAAFRRELVDAAMRGEFDKPSDGQARPDAVVPRSAPRDAATELRDFVRSSPRR